MASRETKEYPDKMYLFSEPRTIQLRRYGFALFAVLILHLSVFVGICYLFDVSKISTNYLTEAEIIQVELIPESYVEVNPEAFDNRPDRSAFYSFKDQQASDLSPKNDSTDRPLLDGIIEDSTKILSGSALDIESKKPLESGIYHQQAKGIAADKGFTKAGSLDETTAESNHMVYRSESFHPFEPAMSQLGVDSIQKSSMNTLDRSSTEAVLIPLTLATAETMSDAKQGQLEVENQKDSSRPLPMKRPKLSSELTQGPLAQIRESVNQLGVIAMDASLSEFGEYEKQFYSAVQNGWYNEINFHQPMESSSRVVVSFVLHSNGTIDAVSVLSTTAGAMATRICESAIVRRSPFRAWTRDMVEVYGASRELTLRFYYR